MAPIRRAYKTYQPEDCFEGEERSQLQLNSIQPHRPQSQGLYMVGSAVLLDFEYAQAVQEFTLPAAVTCPVKNRPKLFPASKTALYPAMFAIELSYYLRQQLVAQYPTQVLTLTHQTLERAISEESYPWRMQWLSEMQFYLQQVYSAPGIGRR
jgi:hypothetical protein